MSDNEFSLFNAEEEVVSDATEFTKNLDSIEKKTLGESYKGLLKNYKKLFRETKRLIRMSDKMEAELSLAKSKLEVYSEKLSLQAATDSLTNLPNRRKITSVVQEALENYSKNKKDNFHVILLDIDHFKKVNDTYGHSAGDTVIKEVSNYMSDQLVSRGLVGRFGGEEFLAILNEKEKKLSLKIAEKIRMGISDLEIKHEKLRLKVTVSMGISSCLEQNIFDSLVDLADERLYQAKESGRNKVVI